MSRCIRHVGVRVLNCCAHGKTAISNVVGGQSGKSVKSCTSLSVFVQFCGHTFSGTVWITLQAKTSCEQVCYPQTCVQVSISFDDMTNFVRCTQTMTASMHLLLHTSYDTDYRTLCCQASKFVSRILQYAGPCMHHMTGAANSGRNTTDSFVMPWGSEDQHVSRLPCLRSLSVHRAAVCI